MASIEKISIALPQEMVEQVRAAVDVGEYASSSEVVREALRDWTEKRALRRQGISELRRVWKQTAADKSPGVAPEKVLDRLERKYRTAAGRAGSQKRGKCA
jgi:antitoxin ParD1/3/4